MASVVDSFRTQGVNVFTYPLEVQLVQPLELIGAFKLGIKGPPGTYTVLGSTNLTTWSVLRAVANPLGSVNFVEATSNQFPVRFYRALLQSPPTNMVFIPPNTFAMGSPTNEPGRNIFEGAQSTVTLTRGFWIGRHEVTQGEYLDVTGTNPTDFPGDLSRSISSVSWFDATNYCWLLTQRELAAGRIPLGSHYRLPTEAEWECAARAGTTTRFSYGDDDVNYTSLTNYAWFLDLGHPDLIVHPVGQKLSNPWGLYDMSGNVWEWCQDWYGDQVGGVQTDPQGPASNVQGLKVIRGGAYDYDNSSCRSASRFFRFANWPDSDVGFRVVLDIGAQ
jgi:formylglycine-generating enzyme required for sulfatase activity